MLSKLWVNLAFSIFLVNDKTATHFTCFPQLFFAHAQTIKTDVLVIGGSPAGGCGGYTECKE